MAPRSELRITDPQALRALAHPARQRLITELFSGEVLTATEAADLVGLTPSATSYHLRALERAGIVVRDEATPDARQRPWRAAADSLSVQPEAYAGPGDPVAGLGAWVRDIDAGVSRLGLALAAEGEDIGRVSHSRLWLDPDEMRELGERIAELVDDYRGRTRTDHPAQARPYDAYVLVLPTEGPSDHP